MTTIKARYLFPILSIALSLTALTTACERQEPLRSDCLINEGPCARTVEGVTVTMDILPKPVRAMRDLEFLVSLRRENMPVDGAAVDVDLSMPGMNMGENKIHLVRYEKGRYTGTGVIVRCPSGQTVWKASVIITGDNYSTSAEFLFEAP